MSSGSITEAQAARYYEHGCTLIRRMFDAREHSVCTTTPPT
jgi:hypothetical protein